MRCITFSVIVWIMLLSGCQSAAPAAPAQAGRPVLEALAALPEGDADIQGVITGRVGNEITLALIEPVSMGQGRGAFGGGAAFATDTELSVTYTGEEVTMTLPPVLPLRSGVSSLTPFALSKKQVLSLWLADDGTAVYGLVTGKAAPEGS